MLDNNQIPGDTRVPGDNQEQLALQGGGLSGVQGLGNAAGNDQPAGAGIHAQAAHAGIDPSGPAGAGQNAGPAISSPSGWFGKLLGAIGKLLPRPS